MERMKKIIESYLSDPKVFADAVNMMVYDGEQKVKPEGLNEQSTEITYVEGFNLEWFDDVPRVMKSHGNAYFLLIGIVTKEKMDKFLPVRVAAYTLMELQKQDMSKKLKPVVPVIVLFRPEEWKWSKSVRELAGQPSEMIYPCGLSYTMTLLSPYELNEEELDRFNSDLGKVLRCVKYSNDKEKLEAYIASIGPLGKKAVALLKDYLNLNLDIDDSQEEVDMCVAMNEIKREVAEVNLKEGEIKGCVTTYQELGISFEEIVNRIAKKFNLSEVEAETVSKQYWIA
ncbi:MAG: hypothetical protein HUJ56_11040 [Erysipelotrichaceae bacterium]|nr:hypothetical protein [Erysipelotrichaceae bacterium]